MKTQSTTTTAQGIQGKPTTGEWRQEKGIISNGRRVIAQINSNGIMKPEFEANAQRIVKAVNVLSEIEDKIKAMNYSRMLNGLNEAGEELLDYLTDLLTQASQK